MPQFGKLFGFNGLEVSGAIGGRSEAVEGHNVSARLGQNVPLFDTRQESGQLCKRTIVLWITPDKTLIKPRVFFRVGGLSFLPFPSRVCLYNSKY